MKRAQTTSRAKSSMAEQRRARKQWLNRRLLAYTATAGAALAVAGTANATIVYDAGVPSGGITVNHANPSVSFNLTGGGSNQFGLQAATLSVSSNPRWQRIYLRALQSGTPGLFPGVMGYAVTRNVLIGASKNVSSTGLRLAVEGTWRRGRSTGAIPGNYVGVKFPDPATPGQTDYGWIDFTAAFHGLSVTVNGWAYDDSGAPILAGDTGVPEPSSLAIWALGALGAAGACVLRRWKKRDLVV